MFGGWRCSIEFWYSYHQSRFIFIPLDVQNLIFVWELYFRFQNKRKLKETNKNIKSHIFFSSTHKYNEKIKTTKKVLWLKIK